MCHFDFVFGHFLYPKPLLLGCTGLLFFFFFFVVVSSSFVQFRRRMRRSATVVTSEACDSTLLNRLG